MNQAKKGVKITDFFIILALIGFLFVAYSGYWWFGVFGAIAFFTVAALRFFDQKVGSKHASPREPPYAVENDENALDDDDPN